MSDGPYRDPLPRVEPPRSWRWAVYAFCFLLTGVPAGISARAVGAYAYGCGRAPTLCTEGVRKINGPNMVESLSCAPGGVIEYDKAEQIATCRCPKGP